MNTYRNKYKQAIEHWGIDSQINQTIEEMAELIKALNKYRRNCTYCEREKTDNAFRGDVVEEMADVYQMLEQLNIIFGVTGKELDDAIDRSYRKMCMELDYSQK